MFNSHLGRLGSSAAAPLAAPRRSTSPATSAYLTSSIATRSRMLHANDKSLSAPSTAARREAARLPIYGKGEKVTILENLQFNVPEVSDVGQTTRPQGRAALGAWTACRM